MGWHPADLPRAVTAIPFRLLAFDLPAGRAVAETLRQVFLSGTSVTAPFLVTIAVLALVFDFVVKLLAPFARALALLGLTGDLEGIVAQALTAAVIVGLVFLIGVFAEAGPATGLGRGLGRVVSAVPGVGGVYTSFDRMSAVILDGDGTSFREVKLVEFPLRGMYSLGFQTAAVRGDAGEELLVLFVPLAPNPVMGGYLVCVPASHVRDVDLTVREAFQALVTSGVVMPESLGVPATKSRD